MSLTNGSPSEAARAAKLSSRTLAILSTEDRNSALQSIHDALSTAKSDILQANARDLEIATKSAEDGELSQSILKRLDLSRPGKFEDMLKGILDVKGLDDPGMISSWVSWLDWLLMFECSWKG
jgi:glutamate-5-semialdehyde dehydrogenase